MPHRFDNGTNRGPTLGETSSASNLALCRRIGRALFVIVVGLGMLAPVPLFAQWTKIADTPAPPSPNIPASTPLAQTAGQIELPGTQPAPPKAAQVGPTVPETVILKAPAPDSGLRALPINLPAALQLAGVRTLDIAVARERLRVAGAQYDQAKVLWLPTVTVGGDYFRHDGTFQDANGNIINSSFSSLMGGIGSGLGTSAVVSIDDAIFAPLSTRQIARARRAEIQAATNDAFLAVAEAYFSVQQARGELAGAIDATQRTVDLVHRTEKLAAGLVSPVEVIREQTELTHRRQAELTAREHWRVASADLLRVLNLDANLQVEPLEPPNLVVSLLDTSTPLNDLLIAALQNRPELASQQAEVQAAIARLRQERMRPFIPYVAVRGGSTVPSGTLAYGAFGGGIGGSMSNFNSRMDVDVQLLWQFDNLGFGNLAKIDQRAAENRQAHIELVRVQDRVAAEVSQALAQAQLAAERQKIAEEGVKLAVESAEKNLTGVGQTKRAGDFVTLIIRPQEAVAAVQALGQAYSDYYGAVADANRAQFRLYRALGQPAQLMLGRFSAPDCVAPAK